MNCISKQSARCLDYYISEVTVLPKLLVELYLLCEVLISEYPDYLENDEDLYLAIFNLKKELDRYENQE